MSLQSFQVIMSEKGGIEEFDCNDLHEEYVSHFYYTRQNRAKGKVITSFKDLKDDIIASLESLLKIYTLEKLNEMNESGDTPIIWSMNWYKCAYPTQDSKWDFSYEENIDLCCKIEDIIYKKYDKYWFRLEHRGVGKEVILIAASFGSLDLLK